MYIAENNINYSTIIHSKNRIEVSANGTPEAFFNVKPDGALYYGEDKIKIKAWSCETCQTCYSCHNCDGTFTNKKNGCAGCTSCNDCNSCNSCRAATADPSNTCSTNVNNTCVNCNSGSQTDAKETKSCKSCDTCQKGQTRDVGTKASTAEDFSCSKCYGSCYICYKFNYSSLDKKYCNGCVNKYSSIDTSKDPYGNCASSCYGACNNGCYGACYGGCDSCNVCHNCLTCNGCTHCVSTYDGTSNDCNSEVNFKPADCIYEFHVNMTFTGDLHGNCKVCIGDCNSCQTCTSCYGCASCTGTAGPDGH